MEEKDVQRVLSFLDTYLEVGLSDEADIHPSIKKVLTAEFALCGELKFDQVGRGQTRLLQLLTEEGSIAFSSLKEESTYQERSPLSSRHNPQPLFWKDD